MAGQVTAAVTAKITLPAVLADNSAREKSQNG